MLPCIAGIPTAWANFSIDTGGEGAAKSPAPSLLGWLRRESPHGERAIEQRDFDGIEPKTHAAHGQRQLYPPEGNPQQFTALNLQVDRRLVGAVPGDAAVGAEHGETALEIFK